MATPDLPEVTESVWTASTFDGKDSWSRVFTDTEIEVLEKAAQSLCLGDKDDTNISLAAVDAAVLALPRSFIEGLHALRDNTLLKGQGFFVLRGLPTAAWGDRKSAAAFLLLSKVLGNLRQQNGAGHVLGHVTDLGLSSSDPSVRVYQTHERQTFHTDSCDVVALLCLRPAKQGGDSFLVSAGAIYNALRARSPHLLRALLKPLATDRRGEIPARQLPFFNIPVFPYHCGHLNVIYQRQYIDSAQRFEQAGRLDPTTLAALDAFDALCNSEEFQVKMRLEPGDVQLVHNHALLHDRSAFVDFEDPALKRHLLRAWIAPCPPAPVRPLPEVYAQRFGSVTPGERGGVHLEGVAPIARWVPPPSMAPIVALL